jgi:hypothetical protein
LSTSGVRDRIFAKDALKWKNTDVCDRTNAPPAGAHETAHGGQQFIVEASKRLLIQIGNMPAIRVVGFVRE